MNVVVHYSKVSRDVNYQPSYHSSLYDSWIHFEPNSLLFITTSPLWRSHHLLSKNMTKSSALNTRLHALLPRLLAAIWIIGAAISIIGAAL